MPVPMTSNYDELFPPTYRFDELPPPWPAVKGGYETPIYLLGWIVRVRNASARLWSDQTPWDTNVARSRWNELGFNNEVNKRDRITQPHLMIYGDHHIIFTIANNYWHVLPPALIRPEVRERAFHQALEVLQFDPNRARVEKVRWFRLPPPDDICRRPVTFPHIYCEHRHVLPDLIREILDGTGEERYPTQYSPDVLEYIEWERECDAREQEMLERAQQQQDSDPSGSSESTTVGSSSS
ncbi:hypothetical protein MD484_g2851, partial [Candolleomyces efflorescens]